MLKHYNHFNAFRFDNWSLSLIEEVNKSNAALYGCFENYNFKNSPDSSGILCVFFFLKKHKDTADSRTDCAMKTKISAPKNLYSFDFLRINCVP